METTSFRGQSEFMEVQIPLGSGVERSLIRESEAW